MLREGLAIERQQVVQQAALALVIVVEIGDDALQGLAWIFRIERVKARDLLIVQTENRRGMEFRLAR